MSLVIEDGSIVEGAASYIDSDYARTYAALRGVTLPENETEIEVLLVQATDYLESFRVHYKGDPVDGAQSLQWPRRGVFLNGVELEENIIPKLLKDAQAQATMDVFVCGDLMPNVTSSRIARREKVDVIEVEYEVSRTVSGDLAAPEFPKIRSLLEPLLEGFGAGLMRVDRGF